MESLIPEMSVKKFLRWTLLAGVGFFLAGVLGLIGAYLYVAGSLPKVDTLADYRPPIITRVYSDDGSVIAEYAREIWDIPL